MGQKAEFVRIIYLLARETSDEIMWRQMLSKHEVLGATLGKRALPISLV